VLSRKKCLSFVPKILGALDEVVNNRKFVYAEDPDPADDLEPEPELERRESPAEFQSQHTP
jgi:hypothetical protein